MSSIGLALCVVNFFPCNKCLVHERLINYDFFHGSVASCINIVEGVKCYTIVIFVRCVVILHRVYYHKRIQTYAWLFSIILSVTYIYVWCELGKSKISKILSKICRSYVCMLGEIFKTFFFKFSRFVIQFLGF